MSTIMERLLNGEGGARAAAAATTNDENNGGIQRKEPKHKYLHRCLCTGLLISLDKG